MSAADAAGPLRVALVAGPMYDHLYDVLTPGGVAGGVAGEVPDGMPGEVSGEVEVVVHADHPTLNRRVAELLAAGERIDVLATHSKYAPSQAAWLRPLDDLLDPAAVAGLAPGAVGLCRVDGVLRCVPRLIDVRVLWSRADRVPTPPDTWAELLAGGAVMGFTGRESGAFGMFFELVAGAGGRLFDDELRPTFVTDAAVEAVVTMQRLATRAPADLPGWHYDDVDRALLEGRVDMAAAWPGGWGAIRDSALADVLVPSPYPAGPVRRVSYSGCHAWAVPTTCGDVPGAVALVERLLGVAAQSIDASRGSMCASTAALAAVEPQGPTDARRLAITRATIADAMITYPSLARFPEIEDAAWSAIQQALLGTLDAPGAVHVMQAAAERVLAAR